MKYLIHGDIHGRDKWKKVNTEGYNKIIFLGDYVDSFDIPAEQQISNLKDIIEFKNNDNRVINLIGNHDYHYLNDFVESYSGFQSKYNYIYKDLLEKLKMDLAYFDEKHNLLFTHAGVSNTWFNKWSTFVNSEDPIDIQLNDIYRYKPNSLLFEGYNNYGDNITQSPIWIRRPSLLKDGLELNHVIGHTKTDKIELLQYKNTKITGIDTPDYYTVIDNGEIKQFKYE